MIGMVGGAAAPAIKSLPVVGTSVVLIVNSLM